MVRTHQGSSHESILPTILKIVLRGRVLARKIICKLLNAFHAVLGSIIACRQRDSIIRLEVRQGEAGEPWRAAYGATKRARLMGGPPRDVLDDELLLWGENRPKVDAGR